jgi:response regulator of citrate/malate metabolism
MGIIKPNNYSKNELNFAKIAGALSHPVRNRIIELLLTEEVVTQNKLFQIINLSKASLNRHINYLKTAKVIECEYSIHFDILKLNKSTLITFQNQLLNLHES